MLHFLGTMNIGYRRFSGKAFLSSDGVKSKRGAWLEKRTAFVKFLRSRGHSVEIIEGDGTFYSKLYSYDLVFLEFGSNNRLFYKEDIAISFEVANKAKQCIFLLDDPALAIKELSHLTWWVNGDVSCCSKHFKVQCEFFPFSSLQSTLKPSFSHNGRIVYYGGTSGSREKRLAVCSKVLPNLEIYGDQKDFKFFTPLEPPEQKDRQNFYHQFQACLNVNDSLHKKLDWRTGRRYHAILAGCPAVDEEPGAIELLNSFEVPEKRLATVRVQQAVVASERSICEEICKKYGL